MATYTTYDQVGKAEDVQDLISIISPSDCPMYTAIRPQKVHARVYQYQQDTLASPADNKAVERGAISITPLHVNQTHAGTLRELKALFSED